MSTYLNWLILFVVISLPILLIMMAVAYAKKKKKLRDLDLLPIAELQSKARALWPRGERLEDVFNSRALVSTPFGSKVEALTETLLEKTFAQTNDFEAHYPILVAHYTWLLELWLRFLEANWSWADTVTEPNLKRNQIFYTEMDVGPAGPASNLPPATASTAPSHAVKRFPRAKDELAAMTMSHILPWLSGIAQRQTELRRIYASDDERYKSIPAWDAAIFESQSHSQTVGLSHQSLEEMHCPPAVLRKEIERLRSFSALPPA